MSDQFEHQQVMGFKYSGLDPVGTRTPINYGTILSQLMKRFYPEMEEVERGSSVEYLYILYRKPVGIDWYGFALFQAARQFGVFTIEIGLSMRKTFPYFFSTGKPDYSIDAIRERMGILSFRKDKWWSYQSKSELETILNNIIRYSLSSSIYSLYDKHRMLLESQTKRWIDKFKYYLDVMNENMGDIPPQIFPGKKGIEESYVFIRDQLYNKTYEKVFPHHIRNQMGNDRFIAVQSAIMSDIYTDRDVLHYARAQHEEGESPNYKDDIAAVVSSRMPPSMVLGEIKETDDDRASLTYSYIKSLSVLESCLGFEPELKLPDGRADKDEVNL